MRVIIYPHDLEIGGSQINAIEIASRMLEDGHLVWVYGRPGALVERFEELGILFIESPDPGRRPSPTVIRHLVETAEALDIDVIHGFEWPPALEALLAARRSHKTVAVATVMSMAVAPFLPHYLPITVGTEQIAEVERARGRSRVEILEPPVDLKTNGPGVSVDVEQFRQTWNIDEKAMIVVCVTRLARQLKLEGILSAIDAAERIAKMHPLQLVIVGDGPDASEVRKRANAANLRMGTNTIILTGELLDPRPAYAASDICIAMGGSALKSMAWAKPLIVQGEGGFFELLTPNSIDRFLWQGWYGVGDRSGDGATKLCEILIQLCESRQELGKLGDFGREIVEKRYSVELAAQRQIQFYKHSVSRRQDGLLESLSNVASVARFMAYHLRRRARKIFGRTATDDFNSNPVARGSHNMPKVPKFVIEEELGPPPSGGVIYFAGAPWDAVAGTDRHLASALALHRPVLWVDPPMSWLSRRKRKITTARQTSVAPGVTRLHVVAPPGQGRMGVRILSRKWSDHLVRRQIAKRNNSFSTIIASSPEPVLAGWRHHALFKVYYATDDFVAGSELLGFSSSYAKRALDKNIASADLVLAVSSELASKLAPNRRNCGVLPNGCDLERYADLDAAPTEDVVLERPIAGMLGQINERLDLDMLEALADLGDSLLLIGPRYEESEKTRRRLDSLVNRPNVQWVGRQPLEHLSQYMACIDIGLTPYSDTMFNRSSFPLKTLEYLSAGKPVVSTDLPSARALNSTFIVLVNGANQFAQTAHKMLNEGVTRIERMQCREFASTHSWNSRANQLGLLIP